MTRLRELEQRAEGIRSHVDDASRELSSGASGDARALDAARAARVAIDAIQGEVDHVAALARETDEEKRTYGPKASARILALADRIRAAEEELCNLQERLDEAKERVDAADAEAAAQRAQEEARAREQAAATAQARAEAEEARRRREEELEAAQRAQQAAAEQERQRAWEEEKLRLRIASGERDLVKKRAFVAEPVGSNAVELTIELALELEREGAELAEKLSHALEQLRKGLAHDGAALRRTCRALENVLGAICGAPTEADRRILRTTNEAFEKDLGALGTNVLRAVGFDDERDKLSGDVFLVLNRANLDNLREAQRHIARTREAAR